MTDALATANVNLQWPDYRSAALHQARARRLVSCWLMISGIIIFVILYYSRNNPDAGAVFFLLPAGLLIGLPGLFILTIRKLYALIPASQRSYQWSFLPDRIETAGELARATVQYQAFHAVTETKTLFLFYYNQNVYHIIPKSSFGSAEEISALRRHLSAILGSRATLRPDGAETAATG